MTVRTLALAIGCCLATVSAAAAQQPLVLGLDVNGYSAERESGGLTAGAGFGVSLGTGLTPRGMVLFGVDAGIAQFHSRTYRLIGHADLGARFYVTRNVFGQIAFSAQGLEEPERQQNFRTAVTFGAGVAVGDWEIAVKHGRFDAQDDWRLSLGKRFHP